MNNRNILLILSPISLFVIHTIYLTGWSSDSFFNKWIDGSFTFFIALVLCNIIRARVVAKSEQSGPPDGIGHPGNGEDDQDDREKNGTS